MAKNTKATHTANCSTCYSCQIAIGTKKACEIAAVSHQNTYGHNVFILPVTR
jgi:hypothetical protein